MQRLRRSLMFGLELAAGALLVGVLLTFMYEEYPGLLNWQHWRTMLATSAVLIPTLTLAHFLLDPPQ